MARTFITESYFQERLDDLKGAVWAAIHAVWE